MTQAAALAQYGSTGVSQGFKNRIINGAMVIDQRNAGASITPSADTYTVDRWKYEASQASKFAIQQNKGSVTTPAGFPNYLGFSTASSVSVGATDYFLCEQYIEGFNTADLGWGTASAKTVTLSFWVYSSLTGTFGGNLQNSANNRFYPFSYTISSANTWEQKTVTIAGDTTGTWVGATNGTGILLRFSLGTGSTYLGTAGSWGATTYVGVTGQTNVVGTGSATWYITGCQLEVGSTATSFDYRPYGTELALCQRYYEKSFPISVAPANGVESPDRRQLIAYSSGNIGYQEIFKVSKRSNPTMTLYKDANAGTNGQWSYYNGSAWTTMTTEGSRIKTENFDFDFGTTGRTFGQAYIGAGNWTADSEL